MRRMIYILAPIAFLATAAAVYALVLPACGALPVFGRLWPSACPVVDRTADQSALADELDRRRALEAEYRQLQRQLAGLGPCPAADAGEPPPMDRDRWQDQDISVMEGCWLLDSDYSVQDVNTHEVHTVPYWQVCLDGQGNGNQTLRMSNGMVCKSAVHAEFPAPERLLLDDTADVPCSQGFRLFRRKTTCTLDPEGRANCTSQSVRGGGTASVKLRRDEQGR